MIRVCSMWFLLVPIGWMEEVRSQLFLSCKLLEYGVLDCTVLLNTIELNTQACHKVYQMHRNLRFLPTFVEIKYVGIFCTIFLENLYMP